jgi:hypothetical protein
MPEENDKRDNVEPTRPKYITISDLFLHPNVTTIAEDVRREIAKENADRTVDEHWLRQAQAWNELANKVVGAEE